MAVWKCSFLTQEHGIFLHMAKQEGICVNTASLLIIYNKKAQRFCRTTKTYTPKTRTNGKSSQCTGSSNSRWRRYQGTELRAMSSLECFAKHETELKQMVLSHQRGLCTTHALLPNEQSTVALKNWDILFKAQALCSLTLKI